MTNIETKLVSTKVGTENGQLLGNTLTGNDAAKGVGVLIEGLATSKNPLMTLKPNDSNSVYKDYDPRGKDDTTGGVYSGSRYRYNIPSLISGHATTGWNYTNRSW